MAYEALSFESGETLTSTKMNKMAGNDAAFHDGTGIDDAAITASKLNFTSIGSKIVGTDYGDEIGTSDTKIATITIDPGKYIIIACGGFHNVSSGNPGGMSLDLKVGSTGCGWVEAPFAVVRTNPSTLYRANPCLVVEYIAESQTTIDLYASTETGTAGVSQMINTNLAAIRIG